MKEVEGRMVFDIKDDVVNFQSEYCDGYLNIRDPLLRPKSERLPEQYDDFTEMASEDMMKLPSREVWHILL